MPRHTHAHTHTLCRSHPSQACSLAVGRRRANDAKKGEGKKISSSNKKNKNSKRTNYLATISICSHRQSTCFDKAALSGEANLKQHPSCRRLAGATWGGRPRRRRRRSESPPLSPPPTPPRVLPGAAHERDGDADAPSSFCVIPLVRLSDTGTDDAESTPCIFWGCV